MSEIRWDGMTTQQRRVKRIAEAKLKGRHTKAEWEALKKFYKYRCLACGWRSDRQADYRSPKFCLEKDHVVPISLGGCDCIGNIQPLCNSCNSKKGANNLKDYRYAAAKRWKLGEYGKS